MSKRGKEIKKRYTAKSLRTGQHRLMLDQVLKYFEIIPDYDLSIMKENKTLFNITANILINIKKYLIAKNRIYFSSWRHHNSICICTSGFLFRNTCWACRSRIKNIKNLLAISKRI